MDNNCHILDLVQAFSYVENGGFTIKRFSYKQSENGITKEKGKTTKRKGKSKATKMQNSNENQRRKVPNRMVKSKAQTHQNRPA